MPMQFRVHPAIGVARVGNSDEFNLAPEDLTGMGEPGELLGGLPIRPGTDSQPITSDDLRDDDGALKRQAVRFRIFGYPEATDAAWPSGAGTEITIGSEVDGKTVSDIVWTVHVANKKANAFVLVEDGDAQGIVGYEHGQLPPIRNSEYPKAGTVQPADKIGTLNEPGRVRALTIDPGPRTVSGANAAVTSFDRATRASYLPAGGSQVVPLPDYPMSFPADTFGNLRQSAGPIDTLGDLRTDAAGRLIFAGGQGRAAGWPHGRRAAELHDDVNNDQWFDDTSDGPVEATLIFSDGSSATVHGAWVTTTDPGFAPQILNIVSLWDDLYDVWVRELGLAPQVYDGTGYRDDFQPSFEEHLRPIFRSAALQQWVTNLNPNARSAHDQLEEITAKTAPDSTLVSGLTAVFRNPNLDQYENVTLMPLALGDANQGMLALRKTQYFFLTQWDAGTFTADPGTSFGAGELLDKAALTNCLGGRFSPGIDLTFTIRETAIYQRDWEASGGGPFRIVRAALDYAGAGPATPLLTAGYVPRHVENGLEPGDLSKFMALPWHTDYNSCATHLPSPGPAGNRTLFWSWPAQRPVAVFTADDVWKQTHDSADQLADPDDPNNPDTHNPYRLGTQRWSVRGPGTDSEAPENWGRFQEPITQMLDSWHRIGVVLQAPAITGGNARTPRDWFLEVGSQLPDTGRTPVVPFPNYATTTNDGSIDERDLFHALITHDTSPEVLDLARQYVEHYLQVAETLSNNPRSPEDQQFFPYTRQNLEDRLNLIYQELVDVANAENPPKNTIFNTRERIITRIIQFAPFNLTDGAWLRNIGETGPMDEVRSLLYSILMDELGDGDIAKNHCNIYLDLCHSVGYYPPPVDSIEFAQDPQILQSAFTVPAFELAISQFSQDYFPELLGMSLQLEWEVVDLKPTRDLLDYFGIDSHFYVMHIGIDNAVNGHGRRAADAIDEYLQSVRTTGGDKAVQAAWRRIWNGFVAFGTTGTFGADLNNLVQDPPSLTEQVLQLIRDKAEYGRLNHQDHTLGSQRIDMLFAEPEEFLASLVKYDYLTPGDWQNSRLRGLLDFETGPMFRVFTDDEIALWAAYTNSLTAPPQPTPEKHEGRAQAARAMAALVDEVRPVQAGNPGHRGNFMSDADGMARSIAWWFARPTAELMEALAAERNDLVVPGRPGDSRFVTELIAPTGPMGSVFELISTSSPGQIRREVVIRWIEKGCPMLDVTHRTLRLNHPRGMHESHPTGHILGMGAVH
ncbi:MAG TPA: LodA/GoxA family CTQ-dependent oxidase [Jatrophihabitans sp.]|nr:LodA/GoxA family CTQ-dependent oxidase [Jatrophihabitans sp.]